MVNAEGVTIGIGPVTGHGVVEPIWLDQIGPGHAEHFPLTAQQPVRAAKNGQCGRFGHPGHGVRRQEGGKPALARRGRALSDLLARDLPP